MNKEEIIKRECKNLKIDLVGFTDGRPSYFLEEALNRRLETGNYTEFEDPNTSKKLDLRAIDRDYRSAIVIGLSYLNDYRGETLENSGNLSRSSWGQDYHRVVGDRIERLIERVEEILPAKYQGFVDTGPLVDRNLAYEAGLGFYGKNNSIINKDYGSFIFIGYIVTDLELSKSSKVQDSCGACRKCIDYCPTGALAENYDFNPRLCVSYLSQTKNKIPYDLRLKMGKSIYGCDICQMVCPRNKNAIRPNHPEFMPFKTQGQVDLVELIHMTKGEFKDKYGDMSGAWRGKNVLVRNAIIALANKRDRSKLDLLLELLSHDSPMIREYSLFSLIYLHRSYLEVFKDREDFLRTRGLWEEYMSIDQYFNKKI